MQTFRTSGTSASNAKETGETPKDLQTIYNYQPKTKECKKNHERFNNPKHNIYKKNYPNGTIKQQAKNKYTLLITEQYKGNKTVKIQKPILIRINIKKEHKKNV